MPPVLRRCEAHSLGLQCGALSLSCKKRNILTGVVPVNFFRHKGLASTLLRRQSPILPSITNKSLMQLARDMGIEVEARHNQ